MHQSSSLNFAIGAALLLAASSLPVRAADAALPGFAPALQPSAIEVPLPKARPVRKRVERLVAIYWPMLFIGVAY